MFADLQAAGMDLLNLAGGGIGELRGSGDRPQASQVHLPRRMARLRRSLLHGATPHDSPRVRLLAGLAQLRVEVLLLVCWPVLCALHLQFAHTKLYLSPLTFMNPHVD